MRVNKNKTEVLSSNTTGALALKIKELRRRAGLKQAQLAEICGVSQVAVSQWERSEGAAVPTSKALVKLSELASEDDRQWWRDLAAEQSGFDAGVNNPLEIVPSHEKTITVALVKIASKVGILGQMKNEDVEQYLTFPASWFPGGGIIRATRVKGNLNHPHVEGGLIALIDISRRDPDRMVGSVVATHSTSGIRMSYLSKDGDVYMLQPVMDEPNRQARILRMTGENSIVGQVLKWIGDAVSVPSASDVVKTRQPR